MIDISLRCVNTLALPLFGDRTLIVREATVLALEHETPQVHIGNVDRGKGGFGRHVELSWFAEVSR